MNIVITIKLSYCDISPRPSVSVVQMCKHTNVPTNIHFVQQQHWVGLALARSNNPKKLGSKPITEVTQICMYVWKLESTRREESVSIGGCVCSSILPTYSTLCRVLFHRRWSLPWCWWPPADYWTCWWCHQDKGTQNWDSWTGKSTGE